MTAAQQAFDTRVEEKIQSMQTLPGEGGRGGRGPHPGRRHRHLAGDAAGKPEAGGRLFQVQGQVEHADPGPRRGPERRRSLSGYERKTPIRLIRLGDDAQGEEARL